MNGWSSSTVAYDALSYVYAHDSHGRRAPTSAGRRAASFRPEITIAGAATRVLVERLTVVDPQARLGEFAGRLSNAELRAVNDALLAVLALD